MKQLKFQVLGLALLTMFSLYSCEPKTDATANTETKDSTAVEEENMVGTVATFNITHEGTEDQPSSIVTAIVNGKETQIATPAGHSKPIPKEEYAQYEIPAEAIDACGGWWAGGGDYYYMVKTEAGVDVYVGWQEEGQEEPGYNWEKKFSL